MKIQKDKVYHIIAGIIISAGTIIMSSYTFSLGFSCLLGFLLASIVGILKELVWDGFLGLGTKSLYDAIATIIGAGFGTLVMFILKHF